MATRISDNMPGHPIADTTNALLEMKSRERFVTSSTGSKRSGEYSSHRILSANLVGAVVLACMMGAVFVSMEACVKAGSPIVALNAPRFVPQSQPDSVEETGIAQDPQSGGIFLQWYGVLGAAGYRVYRSDTTGPDGKPGPFITVKNLQTSSNTLDTVTVDNSANTNVTYYYYVTAYTSDGAMSAPSDTINYRLLPRAAPVYPLPGDSVEAKNLVFNWWDWTSGGYTVIRVQDISVLPPKTLWITPRFEVLQANNKRAFDFDSTATSPFQSGHSYQWRVDRFDIDNTGRPYEGSRSDWWTFFVN